MENQTNDLTEPTESNETAELLQQILDLELKREEEKLLQQEEQQQLMQTASEQPTLLDVSAYQEQQIQELQDIKNYSEYTTGLVFFIVVIVICVWIANRVTDLFDGVVR